MFCGLIWLVEDTAADDFGDIVHHIEAEYHVHRNHRFFMAFAGMVVRCSHLGGAKDFKAAIFENQHLSGSGAERPAR